MPLASTPPVRQEPPAKLQRFYPQSGTYALGIPKNWRPLDPAEAIALRQGKAPEIAANLPADLVTFKPIPGRQYLLGNIDAWMKGKFDGRSLLITEEDGEPPLGEETLRRVRQEYSGTGKLLQVEQTTLGDTQHPAFECQVQLKAEGTFPAIRSLEYLIPTGGKRVRLRFQSWESDYPAAETTFRAMAATAELGQPPDGPDKPSGKLIDAAIIGGIVGLLLIVLHKWTRG